MRSMHALIKREFLEHRNAFLHAPIVILVIITAVTLFGILMGNTEVDLPSGQMPTSIHVYQIGIAGAYFFWAIYLQIGLFFYYADSFSADRRNNALLFWKSMPQSDFKILLAKALSGITIFLDWIFRFALLTAFLVYFVLLIVSFKHPVIIAPAFMEAAWSYMQMALVALPYFVLTLFWYAPILAWVAGLSTLFQRWSIPLAFLIPGVVVLIEYLNNIQGIIDGRPIADFLSWRTDGFMDEEKAAAILMGQVEGGPIELIPLMLSGIDWLHMIIGLVFTVLIIFLASEYRRRRIEA